MSSAFRISKISAPLSAIEPEEPRTNLPDSLHQNLSETVRNVDSSRLSSYRLSRNSRVNIAVLLPIKEEDEGDFEEIRDSKEYTEQNLVGVLREDLPDQPADAFKKKPS